MLKEFLKGYKAGKGRNNNTERADVNGYKKIIRIQYICKLGKEDSCGNVTDELTGNDTCDKYVFAAFTYNALDEFADSINSCNVTGEYKEYTEGCEKCMIKVVEISHYVLK